VVLGGHSIGAELAIWTAAHDTVPLLAGVLAMSPGERGHLRVTLGDLAEREPTECRWPVIHCASSRWRDRSRVKRGDSCWGASVGRWPDRDGRPSVDRPLRVHSGMAHSATIRPVTLDVHVTVQDPDRSAAIGLPVRIIVGAGADWQNPDAGERCLTDGEGACYTRATILLDDRRRKLPSNFFSSLMASRERTRHVQIAIEMEYADRPWLAAIDIDRFENGTSSLLDPWRVYGRASNGRFTDDIPLIDGAYRARLPRGVVLPVPGFDVQRAALDPDTSAADGTRWTLRLALNRWAAPVVKEQLTAGIPTPRR
jgi:hypothetical protein